MRTKYYLLHDNSVQWFTYIIELEGDTIFKMVDVPNSITGPFLNSIFEREVHFTNRVFNGMSYCGWTISKSEYDKVTRMIELYPKYLEYIKLL